MNTIDRDAIRKRIANCKTYNFGMRDADTLAHEDATAMLELLDAQPAGWAVDRDALSALLLTFLKPPKFAGNSWTYNPDAATDAVIAHLALSAQEAATEVEYQRGHDRAEHRYKSAIANYKLVAETFEAERDAALAVLEDIRMIPCWINPDTKQGGFDVDGKEWTIIRDYLQASPAINLQEHDRVIAEKAWDAALAHAWHTHADAKGNVDNNSMLTAMFDNPYRANPEPKEGDRD